MKKKDEWEGSCSSEGRDVNKSHMTDSDLTNFY
jgi:hypothetical protein